MSKFKREDRYRVFKLKYMRAAVEDNPALAQEITHALNRLNAIEMRGAELLNTRVAPEYVVIESDWPIYEEVWKLVGKQYESDEGNRT